MQVAGRADNLLPQAKIHQIVTLADAFSGHEDCEEATEALAKQVAERGDDLLPGAHIEQIATLTFAFAGRDDSEFHDPTHFNNAMDKLALQVTFRSDELLPQASAEQLATLRDMFAGTEVRFAVLAGAPFKWPDEPDYPAQAHARKSSSTTAISVGRSY